MEVVSFTAPASLYPQKRAPDTHWIGSWVGPRAGLDAESKRRILSPRQESNPDHPIILPVASCYTDWSILRINYKKLQYCTTSNEQGSVHSQQHIVISFLWYATCHGCLIAHAGGSPEKTVSDRCLILPGAALRPPFTSRGPRGGPVRPGRFGYRSTCLSNPREPTESGQSAGSLSKVPRMNLTRYEGVTKSFRTESITKYTLTTINTRWVAIQRIMATKLTRDIHKIAIQLHLVAESRTICSSRSRWPVRKLLDTPS
jgi:hypothetical protein